MRRYRCLYLFMEKLQGWCYEEVWMYVPLHGEDTQTVLWGGIVVHTSSWRKYMGLLWGGIDVWTVTRRYSCSHLFMEKIHGTIMRRYRCSDCVMRRYSCSHLFMEKIHGTVMRRYRCSYLFMETIHGHIWGGMDVCTSSHFIVFYNNELCWPAYCSAETAQCIPTPPV